MKVGDLVKTGEHRDHSAVWLVLKCHTGDPTIFVQSVKTGYKMWGNKLAFEVISASR